MKTHTRLKRFEGLPHELSGLDYTTDSEVEGGELSYTPKDSDHEFIFRKNSSNIKELEKQDKLRSKRPEGDRISDISFDAIAKQLMLDEAQQLAAEGIDPFNDKQAFATGGTRLRYTSDGTLSQDRPSTWRHMDEMSTGENVGWSILDAILPVQHFTGRSASEMWSGKTTQDPSSHGGEQTAGSTYGKFSSQYATPMAQGVITGMGGSGMGGGGSAMGAIAGVGQASRRASQPGMDAAAADMGIRFHNADPALKAGLESGGSAIGGTVGGLMSNDLSGNNTPATDQNSYLYNPTNEPTVTGQGVYPTDPELNIPIITNSYKNGGMKKKYSGKNGSVRKLLGENDFWDPSIQDMQAGNMSYIPYAGIQSDYQIPTEQLGIDPIAQYSTDPLAGYTTAPSDKQINNIDGYTTAPEETSLTKSTSSKKGLPDLNSILANIGAIGQTVPALTALRENQKYDKVRYPQYNPELIDGTLPLREARDTFGSTLEALRQRGQLDMGTLSELATQGAKSTSGIRQNIANVNTGIKNDAQLKNIATLIKQFEDEAANKGQTATNRQQALQNLSNILAGTSYQGSKMSNDQLVKQRFTELFGEI